MLMHLHLLAFVMMAAFSSGRSHAEAVDHYKKCVEGNSLESRIEPCTAALEELVERDPRRALVLFNRAEAWFVLNAPAKARADLDAALAITSDNPFWWNFSGALNLRMGLTDKAISHFDTAIKLDPKYGGAYGNRGAVYYSVKQYEKAVADLTIAVRLWPQHHSTHDQLGASLEKLSRHNDALRAYSEAIRLAGNVGQYYIDRSRVFLKLGNTAAALSDSERSITLLPESDAAYFQRGMIFEATGNINSAIVDYGRAYGLNPKNDDARSRIAKLRPSR